VGVNSSLYGHVAPASKTLVATAAVSGVDFDYLPADRTISGVVRAGGAPRAGVWAYANRSNGAWTGTRVSTDASGAYTLPVGSGMWGVYLSSDLLGHVRPAGQMVDVLDGSATGVNFDYLPTTASVTGQFRDSSGSPLAGIWAGAWWGLMSDSGSTPGVPGVWSDASGAYTIPLPVGAWSEGQNTTAGGLSTPARWYVSLGSGQSITGADQVYRVNTSVIAGTVRDAAGNPVYGASVSAAEPRGGLGASSVRTDAQGRYRLSVSEGVWRAYPSSQLSNQTQPAARQVRVGAGETAGNVDFRYLANDAAIVGTVRDEDGSFLADIPLYAYNQTGFTTPGLTTDANGWYTLGVSAGTWSVQANTDRGGHTTPGRRFVTVAPGVTARQDFTYTNATRLIQGTVADGSGAPMTGMWAVAYGADSPSGGWNARALVSSTGSDGRYSARVSDGPWYLLTSSRLAGYVDTAIADVYVEGSNVTVNMVYSATSRTISGRVTAGGLPVRGATVSASRIEAGYTAVPWTYTNAQGNYTLQVTPGDYLLGASASGFVASATRFVAVSGASVSGVDLEVATPTGWLSGLVRDSDGRPLSGANVWLEDKDGTSAPRNTTGAYAGSASTSSAGTFQLRAALQSGRYLLTAAKLGYGQVTVPINYVAGFEQAVNFTLAPQAWGSLTGQITASVGGALDRFAVWPRRPGSLWAARGQTGRYFGWVGYEATFAGRFILSPYSPGDYQLWAQALGYLPGGVGFTVPADSEVTANLALTPTAVPPYQVGYGFVNMPVTMTAGMRHHATLRLENLGSARWPSGGATPVRLGYRWTDALGSIIMTDTTAGNLRYDMDSGIGSSLYATVQAPAYGGVYTVTWDLVQAGAWFADLGADAQSILVNVVGEAQPVDLAVGAADLWLAPPTLRQGETPTATVGLNVHNLSDRPLFDVGVCFREENAGGAIIGACPITVTMIAPWGVQEVTTVWDTSALAATHTLYASVDPGNLIAETLETNNVATRTVVVLPPLPDVTAPLGSLLVNGGAETTSIPTVTLSLAASDTGGSWVAWMQIVESVWNPSDRQWQAAKSSGWITFSTANSWRLTGGTGARQLRAWFADAAGNISTEPAHDWINWVTTCDAVAEGQWRLYGLDLSAGSLVTLTVAPCGADPDLYVWSPWSLGEPDYYSTNSGMAPDAVSFAAGASGFYRVYVYGYEAATFSLSMSAASGPAGQRVAGTRVLGAGKTLPAAAPATAEQPPTYTPQERPPDVTLRWVYLPLVRKATSAGQ
jgi:hypothetical protein